MTRHRWRVALVCVAALGVAIGLGACGDSGDESSSSGGSTTAAPEKGAGAPAFSSDDLLALPSNGWLTNGGSLYNDRYSPLKEITTDNVKDLKGVWMTDLEGSGVAAKYSGEATPIAYAGVLYTITGANDVFAVDVDTGDILWRYEAGLDQKIDTVCCGWTNRGVAIGDGRVYFGQLDGQLVALDMKTGEVDWKTRVADWRKGYTITSAPLYYDGRVVTGLSGGEYGVRGRVTAFDAKTGDEVWRFNTVPGPDDVGGDTWPKGDAYTRGGATVWQTPSVDPELGLMYFSTGNAGPDLDGSVRPGDNLFTASMVAIDAKTGEYRWHFQQVHHDIWDYDGPSPTVLFDTEIDGKPVKGIGEASKTGWVYLLDRATGKPLLPIEEKPVPQLKAQATAKTQPFPSWEPFIPHTPSAGDVKAITKLANRNAKGGKAPKVTVAKGIFEPFHEDVHIIAPGPQGGVNWPSSSYNRDTGFIYTCSQASASGYQFHRGSDFKEGSFYVGSTFTITGFGANPGQLTATDVRTGEIAWQKTWPEACYSGSTTTAGNLVFAGRSDGKLYAFNATTGDELWSFDVGAGANAPASVFEYDGRQYIAFYAAGNALAGSKHGDNLWLFSLDGDITGAAAASQQGATTEEGITHAGEAGGGETTSGASTEGAGDAQAGQSVFAENCAGCHGPDGKGGNGGPNLAQAANAGDLVKVIAQVTNGGGGMPAFGDQLDPKQIRDVAAYVTTVIHGGQ